MSDPKLAKWRSRVEQQAEREAERAARQERLDAVAQARADPVTLEEVIVRLKAIEARLAAR